MKPLLNRLVFIFSLVGLFVAGYLWKMHANPEDIVCGPSHGCLDVALSKYSEFPWSSGVPVAAYGTIGYLLMLSFAFIRTLPQMASKDKILLGFNVALAALGTLASLSLTFAEAFLIHAWCKWCVGSQIIMLCLLCLTLAEWFSYNLRKVAEQS
jgi:uncharacterized membrane protein